jgi:predicted permease
VDFKTAKFVILGSLMVIGLGGGYVFRLRRWASPAISRPLMAWNIVLGGTAIALLSVWKLELRVDLLRLPLVGALLSAIMTGIGYGAANLLRLRRRDTAVFALATGMSNLGYTLGGLLCFVFLGTDGLARAQFFVAYWSFYAFGFCFPFARAHGELDARMPLRRLIVRGFFDRRSMPLAGVLAGIVLRAAGAPRPEQIDTWYLLDAIVATVSFLSFFCIGITLSLRRVGPYARLYLPLTAAKFVIAPMVMFRLTQVFALDPQMTAVAMTMSFMPTAIYMAMTANLFHLDRDMANSLFLVNTVSFFVVVLPLLYVFWLRWL